MAAVQTKQILPLRERFCNRYMLRQGVGQSDTFFVGG